ncbi:MAG: DMT family transporter [Oceanococcus sp.]
MYKHSHQNKAIRRAAVYALSAAIFFSFMGVAIKAASKELDVPMVVFLRNCFGLLALTPLLLRSGLSSLKTTRFSMHLTRCLVGLSAMYCFFWAIAHMPLAEAMLLNYCTPLYIPLIAWLWLKEKPSLAVIPIILIGLFGLALILRPSNPAATGLVGLVGVVSGVLAAVAFVAIRRLSRTEPAVRIVFYFTALSLMISSVPLLWYWKTPSFDAGLLMAAAGLFATLAQYALTRAYAQAPAAQVAPFNYLVVVFAAAWSWLLWHEQSDALSIVGGGLVIASSLLALNQRPQR